MPKHRETIFCVVRTDAVSNPIICASTASLERAEELKGKYEQEMKDKKLDSMFAFVIQTTTFYDE